MERILPEGHRDEETLVRLNGLFDRYYEECYLRHSAPYEGVRRMLAALRGAGIKLAVLSNKPHPFTEKMVEQLFPDTFLPPSASGRGSRASLTPPRCMRCCAWAGTGPERAVYIGDSDVDVQTGHNAGLYVIGVDWGFRGRAGASASGRGQDCLRAKRNPGLSAAAPIISPFPLTAAAKCVMIITI